MRLTCPNCGAIYEVPDSVIPEEGRDVQCSNCANTWFQHPAGWEEEAQPADGDATAEASHEPSPAPSPEPSPAPEVDPAPSMAETPAPDPVETAPAPTEKPDDIDIGTADNTPPATPEAPDPAPSPEKETEPEDILAALANAQDDEDDSEDAAASDTAPAPRPRRELDPSIKELLRQEAEHEAQLRARPSDPIESQPDLGLNEPERPTPVAPPPEMAPARPKAAIRRVSRPEPTEPAADADPAHSRRDLLPNVDDINSTLRSGERRSVPTPGELMPDPEAAEKGSFRSGFFLTLLLAVMAGGTYLQAPALSRALPALAPALHSYVSTVDGARVWLDGQVRGALTWLDGMSSEADPDATGTAAATPSEPVE